ncbi:hypothetical protein MasN3_30930 [Massilia varians]|uniref:Uncharacterized protein n=1 Tax=Massilia varians TaxID=457921 RepID=A0ABN6THX8_9BURK|nr:hypothetical protein MasN3_30930 [Massilia varians]
MRSVSQRACRLQAERGRITSASQAAGRMGGDVRITQPCWRAYTLVIDTGGTGGLAQLRTACARAFDGVARREAFHGP